MENFKYSVSRTILYFGMLKSLYIAEIMNRKLRHRQQCFFNEFFIFGNTAVQKVHFQSFKEPLEFLHDIRSVSFLIKKIFKVNKDGSVIFNEWIGLEAFIVFFNTLRVDLHYRSLNKIFTVVGVLDLGLLSPKLMFDNLSAIESLQVLQLFKEGHFLTLVCKVKVEVVDAGQEF